MGTIATEWTTRTPSQRAINLTNHATGAATVDTGVRDAAIADVEGDFLVYVNKAYDGDKKEHVAAAVRGVTLYLLVNKGEANADAKLEKWQEQLKKLALIDARNRVAPESTSSLTPSDEVLGSETVRPWFDSERNDDQIPGRRGRRRDDSFPTGRR